MSGQDGIPQTRQCPACSAMTGYTMDYVEIVKFGPTGKCVDWGNDTLPYGHERRCENCGEVLPRECFITKGTIC